jgi:hypothetical protein
LCCFVLCRAVLLSCFVTCYAPLCYARLRFFVRGFVFGLCYAVRCCLPCVVPFRIVLCLPRCMCIVNWWDKVTSQTRGAFAGRCVLVFACLRVGLFAFVSRDIPHCTTYGFLVALILRGCLDTFGASRAGFHSCDGACTDPCTTKFARALAPPLALPHSAHTNKLAHSSTSLWHCGTGGVLGICVHVGVSRGMRMFCCVCFEFRRTVSNTCACVLVLACMYASMQVCMHVHVPTFTCEHVCVCVCACLHACACMFVHACLLACLHA